MPEPDGTAALAELRQVEVTFRPLQERLKLTLARYNPSEENLHFSPVQPDADLFPALVALCRDGVAAVERHQTWFAGHDLYEPWYWYDLFTLISASVLAESAGDVARRVDISTLVELLVQVAAWTQRVPADIAQRNHEALGNTILAFPEYGLDAVARRAAGNSTPEIQAFVEHAVQEVLRVREKRMERE